MRIGDYAATVSGPRVRASSLITRRGVADGSDWRIEKLPNIVATIPRRNPLPAIDRPKIVNKEKLNDIKNAIV